MIRAALSLLTPMFEWVAIQRVTIYCVDRPVGSSKLPDPPSGPANAQTTIARRHDFVPLSGALQAAAAFQGRLPRRHRRHQPLRPHRHRHHRRRRQRLHARGPKSYHEFRYYDRRVEAPGTEGALKPSEAKDTPPPPPADPAAEMLKRAVRLLGDRQDIVAILSADG